jgi:GT2 family glycosyltransferase
MMELVHILLPVYNRRAVTEKFIECLCAQSYRNYHLLLIDDGSTDGTSEMVSERINNLTVLRGVGDWWWAGSLQQGIEWLKRNAADDDVVLFINDDVTFGPEFLMKAVELLQGYRGMLLPQVLNTRSGCIEESGVEADLRKLTFKTASSPERINCLPTRGLFMYLSVIKQVGDFFPRLLPHYLSDYEYTIRAYRMGIPLRTSPELTISFNEMTTGYRNIESDSFVDFLTKYFSNKYVNNPIHWSMFILLSSPKMYIPWHLLKVWARTVRDILKQGIKCMGLR